MARRKRGYRITGDEYNFGAAGSSGVTSNSSFLRIYKGSSATNSADFDGFLNDGDTVTIKMDASSAVATKDQYVYFDDAFEGGSNGTYEVTFTGSSTGYPANLAFSSAADGLDASIGYVRYYGNPIGEGTHTWSVKYYDNAGTEATIHYVWKLFAAGTTPVFQSGLSTDRIIRNLAGEQDLVSAPTTTYADAVWTIKDVSGFDPSVTPLVDRDTGRVYVADVGDVVAGPATHSFTLVGNFGTEIGTFEQAYTGVIAYGDPYGARYFGPANASTNITGQQNYSTVALSDGICNPKKSSGAVKRYANNQQDTSPYMLNDGYGCQYFSGLQSYVNATYYNDRTTAYVKNGVMGLPSGGGQCWSSSTNHQWVRFRWQVPAGVTSIAAVAVGGGGPGMYSWSSNGGGGGGCAWMNGIAVTAGQEFEICVGLGRYSESSNSSYGAGPSWLRDVASGDVLIYAQGGGWHGHTNSSPNGQSTTYTGGVTIAGLTNFTAKYASNDNSDGGGWGVNSNWGSTVGGFHFGGGTGQYAGGYAAGGAGGYRGDAANNGHNSNPGHYGGGGGGWYYSSTYGAGAGGGTGLDGQGWGGAHTPSGPDVSVHAGAGWGGNSNAWTSFPEGSSAYYGGGGGGSGGTRGSYGQTSQGGNTQGEWTGQRTTPGGLHGGGGGGSGTSWGGGHGGSGGVRIIWGIGADGTERCFPYNYASERPDMKVAGTV